MLVDIAGIMVGIERMILGVGDFGLAHPERFRDAHELARAFIGTTTEAAHDELPGGDPYKCHPSIVREIDHLAVGVRDLRPGLRHRQCQSVLRRGLNRRRFHILRCGFRFDLVLAAFVFIFRRGFDIREYPGQLGAPFLLRASLELTRVPSAYKRRVEVDPGIEPVPPLLVKLHAVMAFPEQLDERTGGNVVFHRIEHFQFTLGAGPSDIRVDGLVGLVGVGHRHWLEAVDARGTIMATRTELPSHGIHLIFKSEWPGFATPRSDLPDRAVVRDGQPWGNGGTVILMASHAGDPLAWHAHQPGAHQLQRRVIAIQRLERDRCIGGDLEANRTVGFDGHGAQDALDIPTGFDAQRRMAAGADIIEVVREHAQIFDRSPRHALEPGAAIDIRDVNRRGLGTRGDAVGDHRRARAGL